MRKFLAFLLLCAGSCFGTTPITGTLRDPGTGTVSSGAFIRVFVRGCSANQPRVNGVALIPPRGSSTYYVDFAPNSSGVISGTVYSTRDAAGTGNGEIQCGTSFTSVWLGIQPYFNGVAGVETPVHSKNGSTLDITNVTAITTTPVVTAPTGDGTYLRLDGGNSPITGGFTSQGPNSFTGSNTFSGPFTTATLNGLGVAQGSTIASLVNAGGDIIVPNGNYVLLADLTPPSNTTIFCVGWNAKFTMPSVTGAHNMITISGKTNIRVIGCQFDGTGMTASTGDSHVIRAISSSNILLDGIWIHDSPEDCVRLGPSVSSGNVSNSRITNATLANCGTVGPSGSGVGCTDCTSITIDHNTITTPHLDGIDIEPQCVTCDGSKNTVDTNYLIGAGFSSHGISYWNHNGGTQQNNTTVGNTILQFAGGACVVLIGNTDGTVSANTEFACLVGTELQNSTLVTVGANDLKSDVTGILMDGASNTNNIISGTNINNSTTGITETNGSNGNTFRNIKFSANSNNFGTVGCSSVADWDTGNGGLNLLIPCNANTAGFSILDAPSGSTHKLQFFPDLGAGNFYGTIQNGDALINYPNPLQIGAGIRDDGTGKWTAFNLFTLSGGLKFANLLISNTAPTIAAGGCGGAAAAISGPPNGTAAFAFNVGTTPTSACTLTLPAAATAWNCDAFDQTSSVGGGYFIKQTNATSQTSVVLSFFSTAGAATAPTASDIVRVKCSAY